MVLILVQISAADTTAALGAKNRRCWRTAYVSSRLCHSEGVFFLFYSLLPDTEGCMFLKVPALELMFSQ